MPLDPRVVVADDILVVQAREQRHLTFDPSELFAGRVDLDALHSVVAAVQVILNLETQERERGRNKEDAKNTQQTLECKKSSFIKASVSKKSLP